MKKIQIIFIFLLLVVSISLVITGNINRTTKNLEEELTIIVYLEKSSTETDINNVKASIESMDDVASVEFKSKDQWKLEMSKYNSSFGTVFKNYEDNPLLDSFTVTVKDAKTLSSTTESIRKIEKVESFNLPTSLSIIFLSSIVDIVEKATIVIMIALIFVTAFLITNTIKLTIYSRRSEIEIMRLVGASNIAIKMPFVIEGFLIGIIGSLIPIIVTIYGYIIAYEKLDGHILTDILRLIEPTPFVFYVSLLVISLGAIIGMFGSLNAVRKYLKIW